MDPPRLGQIERAAMSFSIVQIVDEGAWITASRINLSISIDFV
jgi:hypothetical protein